METKLEKAKPSVLLMTLEMASKSQLIKHFSGLTLRSIVAEGYPSIASLKKSYNVEDIDKVIQLMVLDLSSSFEDALSEEAIEELSLEISHSMFKNLSFEDVYFCFRQIKTGVVKFKLNLNQTMRYLQKHMEEKSEAIYLKNYNEHLANKISSHDRKSAKEQYLEGFQKFYDEKKKETELNETKEILKNAKKPNNK